MTASARVPASSAVPALFAGRAPNTSRTMMKRGPGFVPVCIGCWLELQVKTPLDNRETRTLSSGEPCVVCDGCRLFMFSVEVLEGRAIE